MAIERWHPITELMSLRRTMDRLFEDSFVRPSRALKGFGEMVRPALDIYQKPDEVVVKAALPGVKAEDVNIDITGDALIIKGGEESRTGNQEGRLFVSGETLRHFFRNCGPSYWAEIRQG